MGHELNLKFSKGIESLRRGILTSMTVMLKAYTSEDVDMMASPVHNSGANHLKDSEILWLCV